MSIKKINHWWTNGCSVFCASKELWIKMYAHSVRIDKIWSHFIGWVWYINMYQSIKSFNIPLSQQPPQAFEVLRISLFLGPKYCSNSQLKVFDLIDNFCKRQNQWLWHSSHWHNARPGAFCAKKINVNMSYSCCILKIIQALKI